jgi:enamine deaminase RidA (YjgF/YER057c/UK114 family)
VSVARVRAGAPNEERFGFVQAVRAGPVTWVAGQVGKDNVTGAMVGDSALASRLERSLANVMDALEGSGATAGDLVDLQLHVAGAPELELATVERVHREVLGGAAPAASVVRVGDLSHAEYLVEVSAVAITPDPEDPEMQRTPVGPAQPADERLGASAAVRVGPHVHVGGRLGFGPDVGEALRGAVERLDEALGAAGATLADVVSHHLYVVSPVDADGFAVLCEVHRAAFGAAPPAATLVLVGELADPDARVLLSAIAYVEPAT